MALSSTSGGPYSFVWTNMLSPLPYETNGGSFVVEYYSSADGVNAFYRKFTFSGSYPSLAPTTFSVSTASCQAVASGKNGNLDCSITIPFTNTLYTAAMPIQAVEVDFTSTTQYTTIHPFCQAYISSGTNVYTASKKQLLCSRLDTSSSAGSAKFFITGFTHGTATTSYVVFSFKARGTTTTTTLSANIYSQVMKSGSYYTVLQQTPYSYTTGTFSTYMTTSCKLYFEDFFAKINFYRFCSWNVLDSELLPTSPSSLCQETTTSCFHSCVFN